MDNEFLLLNIFRFLDKTKVQNAKGWVLFIRDDSKDLPRFRSPLYAPVRWTSSLTTRPWVETVQQSSSFFQSFQALEKQILTSLYPHFILWCSARNRSKEHRNRAQELHWVKGQSWPKNPQILVLQAPNWHLKTSQRTARYVDDIWRDVVGVKRITVKNGTWRTWTKWGIYVGSCQNAGSLWIMKINLGFACFILGISSKYILPNGGLRWFTINGRIRKNTPSHLQWFIIVPT